MTGFDLDLHHLPSQHRAAFRDFARVLLDLAGDNLLALCATGPWTVSDPLWTDDAATSLAVLRRFDLRMLDRFAADAARFGRRHIAAPVVMTPEYIRASCDTFPLELLEMQQLHLIVRGEDPLVGLAFESRHLRLQCERAFKGELLHLRQGLLTVAGAHAKLGCVAQTSCRRVLRALRGLLKLAGPAAPAIGQDVVPVAAAAVGLALPVLAQIAAGETRLLFDGFERYYGEIGALVDYVDHLHVPTG